MMTPTLHDTSTVPDALLTLLESHLPYSLPVLRRLQFARNFPGGLRPTAHILYAYHAAAAEEEDTTGQPAPAVGNHHFVAAYVDLVGWPETECYIYSTLEDSSAIPNTDPNVPVPIPVAVSGAEALACDELALTVLRRIRRLEAGTTYDRGLPRGEVMVGSLHEVLRQRLMARGVRMHKTANVTGPVDWHLLGKWLFRVEDLVGGGGGEKSAVLPAGMLWDTVRREDLGLVRARTSIARQEATLLLLPSTVIRLHDNTPIAWAFLSIDGTLSTLHVEEPYRGLGLAKAVASRVMRDHLKDFGNDGWGAADVFNANFQSQGVCKSIGGKHSWTIVWAILDLFSVGDAI
ncbi:hypothetical protein B0T17DRAFT_335467 [Bombardia bombarda]|uniref:FR47-like domain-containing protein n=1 Tax=Bombardia bombarda TaxID=252184 RepID=A0AA39WMW9_9PEZI|nr:hypothetical protein B0T17DRAFT_335467 [Bombardia bombarda]